MFNNLLLNRIHFCISTLKELYNYELYFRELDIKYFFNQRSACIRIKMLMNHKRRIIILYLFKI